MRNVELLSRYNVLRSVDRAESEAILSRELCPHVLKPANPGRLKTVENRVKLASSALMFVRYGARVSVTSARVDAAYLVVLPHSGRSRVRVGRHEIETCSTRRGVVINPDVPFLIEGDEDTAALVWRVERDALAGLAECFWGTRADIELQFAPPLDLERGAGAAVARTVRFLAQELDAAERQIDQRPAVARMEEALMLTLLEAKADGFAAAAQLAASTHGRRALMRENRALRTVEDLLHASVVDGVSVAELVKVSGLCARTLFRTFRKAHGVTPMQYLRRLRLERVREDLQHAGPDAGVTEILSRWGVTQFGRFAADYRRRYGERPSQTLQRPAQAVGASRASRVVQSRP